MTLAVGSKIGRYRLLAKLGEGGYGEVWKAQDLNLGREIVLKCPKAALVHANPTVVTFFPQEAKAASHLFNHPHVVAVLDLLSYADNGINIPCIAMEYIAGVNGRDFARTHLAQRQDHLTRTSLALYTVFCSAKALMHAHEKGIIHRDVKPQNVLVGNNGFVKLADFGLAKFAHEATRLVTGKFGGTELYAAPEQVKGAPGSIKTDMYQLGCMLYEMLEGKAPFEEKPNDLAIAYAKVHELEPDPARMNGLRTTEKEAVIAVYRGLVAADPAARWNAFQVVEALAQILHRPTWTLHVKNVLNDAAKSTISRITQIHRTMLGPAEFTCEFQDPEEALTETIALLLAGAGRYVWLTRA